MVMDFIELKVGGRSYQVTFPKVGQFYQIEAMKQTLSRGLYNSMVLNPTPSSQHALDMIDIEATLAILCPSIIEELKVKNLSDLDIRDYKQIRDAYMKNVVPMFKEVMELLKGEEIEE